MSSVEGREPYGSDHWIFRSPKHPRDQAWRRASLREHEVGLRAATWEDFPFDLHNALARHRAVEAPPGELEIPA